MAKKKKSGMSAGKEMAISAGIAAVSAGAYYFLGPKGKRHQKKTKAWMKEMENEVEKKLKKAKSVTEPLYHKIVDAMATTYSNEYKEHEDEIDAYAKKLKGEWKKIERKARSLKKSKSASK
jgi:hypothetical protein